MLLLLQQCYFQEMHANALLWEWQRGPAPRDFFEHWALPTIHGRVYLARRNESEEATKQLSSLMVAQHRHMGLASEHF